MRWLLIVMMAAAPLVQAGSDDDATRDLLDRLSGLETLTADFQQYTLTEGGERLQESRGYMELERPRKFRWHSREPFEQVVVSDGDVVWVHDVDLEQVVERRLSDEIANTPALLFSGDTDKVSDTFAISELSRGDGRVTWRLMPREDEQLFTLLEVTFEEGRPESMRMEDALGQKTRVEFRDLTLNVDIDPERFRFEPPEGTDVISEL